MSNSDVELELLEGLEEVVKNADTIKSLLHLVEEERNRHNQKPSIFMVPRQYRDQNPSCFDPQVVSIGPLHRGHKNVQEHEGLKKAYMHDLLARLNRPPQQTLERCLSKVISSINDIRLCYGGMNNYRDFDVAIMMVTDACFILEFIQKFSEGIFVMVNTLTTTQHVFTDLLLIENQIPFFILKDIFNLTLKKIQQNDSLITLLLCVLDGWQPLEIEPKIDNHEYNFKHILEILHKSCMPDDLLLQLSRKSYNIAHSAVDLDRAGVKFKPNQGRNMAVTLEYESFQRLSIFQYFRRATLRMPVLFIADETELVLRNLIAYEQSYPNLYGQYFTSLGYIMDHLIDNTEDVAKLVESRVIVNYLGSNENAANMINNICNGVTCINFSYERQVKELDDYYKSYWPKHMARLRGLYFNSPWSMIALIAGILLFALTAIQTIFTVKSFIFSLKSTPHC